MRNWINSNQNSKNNRPHTRHHNVDTRHALLEVSRLPFLPTSSGRSIYVNVLLKGHPVWKYVNKATNYSISTHPISKNCFLNIILRHDTNLLINPVSTLKHFE